jgi:LysR family nitrogen assimilation transcriptional regulator
VAANTDAFIARSFDGSRSASQRRLEGSLDADFPSVSSRTVSSLPENANATSVVSKLEPSIVSSAAHNSWSSGYEAPKLSPPRAGKSPDLREMRSFLSVSRTGNFGRAARELNVSQQTVTHQIRKLEVYLGLRLLVRHGRGVSLTRAGICFRTRVEQIMQLLASPLCGRQRPANAPSTVSVAVPTEFGPLLVVPLVDQFRALWPTQHLVIQESSSAALEERVLDQRVDIAVVQYSGPITGLEMVPVLSEPLGLVMSTRSPLADTSKPMKFRNIVDQKLILPNQQHWISRKLDQAAFQAGVQLGAVVQVDGVTLTKLMIRNALGCAVLPASAVQDELSRGVLAFRPIVRPSLVATYAIAYRHTMPSAVLLSVAKLLRVAMISSAASKAWPGGRAIGFGGDSPVVTAVTSLCHAETGVRTA